MATTRVPLSNSSNYKAILVAATISPGTPIHTATSNASEVDVVQLYAQNFDVVDRDISVEWGSSPAAKDTVKETLKPNSGWVMIGPQLTMNGAQLLAAFASVGNIISVTGHVDRVNQA